MDHSNAIELTLVGGGSPIEEMVRSQTKNMRDVIMQNGGKIKNVVFWMAFQVLLKTEDSKEIGLQPISEKMEVSFVYDSEFVSNIGNDTDKRIGETAFQLTKEILKQINEVYKAGKLDEHRPED
jgi:hypothetical protein